MWAGGGGGIGIGCRVERVVWRLEVDDISMEVEDWV